MTTIDYFNINLLLAQRYPFLMIDRIIEINRDQEYAKCIKNVSNNEEFFQGHFPGQSVMPGVLILEAMAQTSIVIARAIDQNINGNFLLAKIDNVIFKKKVIPGDVLTIKAENKIIKKNIYISQCTVCVDSTLVASAKITAVKEL